MIKHSHNKNNFTLQAGRSYKTASGLLVEIIETKESKATFNCRGYLFRPNKHGKMKKVYNIWAKDGRLKAVWGWSKLDIVAETIAL